MSWWKKGLAGLGIILVVLIAVGVATGNGSGDAEEDHVTERPLVTRESMTVQVALTSTVAPTATREWTVAELVECDPIPGDLMSDCEVALTLAHLRTIVALEEDEVLAAQLEPHLANLEAFQASMDEMMADRVIDLEESRDYCYKLPQWRVQLAEAGEALQGRGLTGLEVDVVRATRLLAAAECR